MCIYLFVKEYFLCVMVIGVYILVEDSGEEVIKGRRENN